MPRNRKYQNIRPILNEENFNEFVLPYLTNGSRGPRTKISFYRIFNYILKLMHTGCQWEELPIEKDSFGKPEIHYTRVFRTFQRWMKEGCFEHIFVGSIYKLFKSNLLDTTIIHRDGSTTPAKRGETI